MGTAADVDREAMRMMSWRATYYRAVFAKDLRPEGPEWEGRLGKVSCPVRCKCWAEAGDRVFIRRQPAEDVRGGRRWLVIARLGRAVLMDDATAREYLRSERDAAGRPVVDDTQEPRDWFGRMLYELKPRSEW